MPIMSLRILSRQPREREVPAPGLGPAVDHCHKRAEELEIELTPRRSGGRLITPLTVPQHLRARGRRDVGARHYKATGNRPYKANRSGAGGGCEALQARAAARSALFKDTPKLPPSRFGAAGAGGGASALDSATPSSNAKSSS